MNCHLGNFNVIERRKGTAALAHEKVVSLNVFGVALKIFDIAVIIVIFEIIPSGFFGKFKSYKINLIESVEIVLRIINDKTT